MNAFETHGIDSVSPSSCNLFASSIALFVMEKVLKIKSQVGAAAHRGTASETGIIAALIDPAIDRDEAVKIAKDKYRSLTALSGDPNRDREGNAVDGIVRNGLDALHSYGIPDGVQGKIEYKIDDLAVPFVGYYDLMWSDHGMIVDIKTQLRLASNIKTAHARQVSLYKAALSDNLEARICYITDKKSAVYTLENYRDHVKALERIALTMQRFLSLSNDPHELAALVCPDVDSFYFNDPVTRQNAYEVFGL